MEMVDKAIKALIALMFSAGLSGCAHNPSQPLSGDWTLETVNGVKQQVTIRVLEQGFLYLHHPDQHLSGKYEVFGNKMTLEEADNLRTQAAAIKINSENELTVTEAPPTRLTGVRYLGASIIRKPLN